MCKIKNIVTWPWPHPRRAILSINFVVLFYPKLCVKFEWHTVNGSRNKYRGIKLQILSRDPDHANLGAILHIILSYSSVLRSVQNLNGLSLTVPEKIMGYKKIKNLVTWPWPAWTFTFTLCSNSITRSGLLLSVTRFWTEKGLQLKLFCSKPGRRPRHK